MSTVEHPAPFPFTLKAGQLREVYKGCEMTKYNENVGTIHNRAKLQFASMLAKNA
jgi:tellurite methyltransferase